MRKAIILARVSSVRQEQEGLSLTEIQLPILRKYAKENNFDVVQEFVFQESADRKIRKKFEEMVKFAKSRKDIDVIISYRVDRITRNFRDAVAMDNLRIDYGKELHFVQDRLIIDKNTLGRDIQDWDVKVFLAKQAINRLQEDAHVSAYTKLAKGELPGPAPYGYENKTIDKRTKDVVTMPYESKIVQKIFEWYATGAYSIMQVRLKLLKEYGIKLSQGQIFRILTNTFYYGVMEYKGKQYPHRYEILFTKDVYDKVQEIRLHHKKKKFKYQGLPYAYRGLIKCEICGCAITPEKKDRKLIDGSTNTHVYYHCTQYFGKHKAPWIPETELTEQFESILKRLKIPESNLKEIVSTLRESHESKAEFIEVQKKELNDKYNLYQQRIEKAYLDKLDGRITQDMYDNLETDFRKEQDKILGKLNALQQTDEEYYITAEYILTLASKAHELFIRSEHEEKRKILNLVFQDLTLKGQNVEYEMKKPFDKILVASDRSEWLVR